MVADERRVDVLEGRRVGADAGRVQPRLVREGVLADVGLVGVGLAVEQLVGEVRDVGEPAQLLVGDDAPAHLQLQVGDDRDEVRVAGALADAVHRALHLGRAGLDGHERVGDRAAAVVVAVDADRHAGQRVAHVRDVARDVARQRGPVRVAQHERARRPRPPRRAGTRSRSRDPRADRRRRARRRRSRACPAPTRKATDSAIIARFSSRETRTTFSTWLIEVLPTIVQIGAKQPARTRSPASSAAATPRRRVMPKAAIVAWASSSCSSSAKSSASLGLDAGKPASMMSTPRSSRRRTRRTFSSAVSDMPPPPIPSRRVAS